MVEEKAAPADMFWIVGDPKKNEHCWTPGVKVEDRGDKIAVKCLLTGKDEEIKRAEAVLVHPSCLGMFPYYIISILI